MLASDRLGARVRRVDGGRRLNDEEIDALEVPHETLARRETSRRIGEELCRESKDAAASKPGQSRSSCEVSAWTASSFIRSSGLDMVGNGGVQ